MAEILIPTLDHTKLLTTTKPAEIDQFIDTYPTGLDPIDYLESLFCPIVEADEKRSLAYIAFLEEWAEVDSRMTDAVEIEKERHEREYRVPEELESPHPQIAKFERRQKKGRRK